MISPAKQLQIFSENGEKAPDSLIEKLIYFENKVYEMRQAQINNLLCKKQKEKEVDNLLKEMGYYEQTKF